MSFFLRMVLCAFTLCSFHAFTYMDQKQNCSKHVTDTFCYDGPQFDDLGQYKSCSVPNTLALTFDDCCDSNINFYLDALDKFKMKATFFVIGRTIQSNPAAIQRIVDSGHLFASHTYSHAWLTQLTYNKTRHDFLDFENAVLQQNFKGVLSNRMVPSYFRAPNGALSTSILPILQEFGVISMHWGFLNGDTTVTDSAEILPIWKSHLNNADASTLSVIMQQHEVQDVTTQSLYDVLYYLNTTFPKLKYVTVDDCIGNVVPRYHISTHHQEDPMCKTVF